MSRVKNIIQKTEALSAVSTATSSAALNISGGQVLSCQAVVDVESSAKSADSPHLATLVNQSLTYTSVDPGDAANDITIELVDTGVPDQTLEINVTDSAISVNLALDAGTASELEVQDLTYTADDAGAAGDEITIAYIDDGTAGAETVDVTGTDIVVHMDATVVIGSTATQIKTAVDASMAASALISVAVTGTGSNVQDAVSETPLAGGIDPAITTTGNALKSAINADSPGAADLVLVSGTNASALVALSSTPLAGGDDGEVDVEASSFSIPSHGFATGTEIQITATGTQPSPLLTGTDYYVIVLDADTIQLAETVEDAADGTFIELDDAGSDNNVTTFTPTTLSGATIKLEKSNDGENWNEEVAAQNVTADGSIWMEKVGPSGLFYRATIAISDGSFDCDLFWLVKGIDG